MGEELAFSVKAHVFQIDQQTKKRWLPSSTASIRVAYYHDPNRKTYRIIAIENSKALINSTITANMNFTKTSPKFGQWSDHRANTVYGLGFSSEKDLQQFMEWFSKAKEAARKVVEKKKRKTDEMEKMTSNSSAESKPEQAMASSPPDAATVEEAVVMNGDGRKSASSSEPPPAVSRNGGSADTQLETLRYENNKLKSALASR
jgi:homer protein